MDKACICTIHNLRRGEELIISFIAAAISGVLSGWGVGGGTLLLIFMTAFQNIPAGEARVINLLYFLPTASGSLYGHLKNGFIDKKAFIFTAASGVCAAFAVSMLSENINTDLMRRLFGIFLIALGIRELFKKTPDTQ